MTKTKTIGDVIIGIHPIIELLKAKQRKLYSIYTTKPTPKGWDVIQKLVPSSVQVHYVPRDALHRMAGTSDHQGVIAYAQEFVYRKKPFDPTKQQLLVLLDSIQDPRNVGAILRSAYCTGIDGVILCQKESAPLNAVALKASAGLAEHLSIRLVASAQQAVQELKQAGYHIYLAAFGGENAHTYAFSTPCCLVIGNEGVGVTKSLFAYGTQITLPQRTADVSYNASVAAGILLFLVATQHKKI